MRFLRVVAPLLLCSFAAAKHFKTSLILSSVHAAPDGTSRRIYAVNGTTPGPTIYATVGDTLEVEVVNKLPVETTLHWHGIAQKGTVWSDGVPGVTQSMIPQGASFIAQMKFDQHGHFWYHAHSRAIYGDGVLGNIIVHPTKKELELGPWSLISKKHSDIEAMKKAHMHPKPLAMVDWTHYTSEDAIAEWDNNRIEPLCVDSVLINGKGRQICPPPSTFAPLLNPLVPEVTAKGCGLPTNPILQPFPDAKPDQVDPKFFFTCHNSTTPLEVFEVDHKDGWASIAIVGTSSLWNFVVSIDDHPMWVYAADGQWHFPQLVNSVNVGPGERYTAMIRLDKPISDYAIRVAAQVVPQFITGYAVLSYHRTKHASKTIPEPKKQAIDYGGNTLKGFKTLDISTLKPFPPLPPAPKADVTLLFPMFRLNSLTWTLNKDPFQVYLELEKPLLFDPHQKIDPNLVPAYPIGSVVDVVLQLAPGNPSHPIHKHGFKFWILGSGTGNFTWPTVAEAAKANPKNFNLIDPPYRDGLQTPAAVTDPAWIVIRFTVTEPGVVFFHCHINIHQVGGMAVALMQGMNGTNPVHIPKYYRDFEAFAQSHNHHKKGKRTHVPYGMYRLDQ